MSEIRKKRYKKKEFDTDKYFLPILSVIVCFVLGIWFVVDSSNYVSATSAVIEGKLLSVTSKSQGYIIQTFVEEGQEVSKGDLLMEINPSDYEYRLRQAEDKLRTLKIQLNESYNSDNENSKLNRFYPDTKQKKSMFSFPHKDFENYAKMFGYNSEPEPKQNNTNQEISDKQQAQPEPQKEEKKLTPEQINQEIKNIEAEIEQLRLNISYTKIYAPQDGIISVKQVSTGEYVEVAQPVVSIIPKRVWVSAKFDEQQLPNIKYGQNVVVKIRNYPNRKFKGVVEDIPNLENKNTSENPIVKIMFIEDYSDFKLTPGLSVDVKVKL